MNYNEDYKNGMKFLMSKCKEQGVNIHGSNLRWLIKFSKMLSDSYVCYKFWLNVEKQHRIKKINECKCLYDVFYAEYESALFKWEDTDEERDFWFNILMQKFWGLLFKQFNDYFWQS